MDIKLEKTAMQICRICLEGVEPGHPIFHLNCPDSPNNSVTVQDKLIECVPELNMNTVPNATICNECFQLLNSAYSFKRKCLQTEMQINKYLQQINATILHNLSEVWHNVGANKSIKVEELVMPDLKMEMDDGSFNDSAVVEDTDFKNSAQEILIDECYTDPNCTDTYYSCYMCGYATESYSDLSLHIQTHSAKIPARAQKADAKLIPDKSKCRYEKELELYQRWEKENRVETICEDVIMAYIDELREKFAPNSLSTKISMLKSSLLAKRNINIGKFCKIDSYLRQNSVGYTPKKSKTLSKEEVLQFLNNAPDEDYLMEKVVLTFGILGACRRGEMTFMKTTDIEDKGSVLVINIPETNNYKKRSFYILENQKLNAMSLYRKYVALRPDNVGHDRFFLSFKKGRCSRQPVGKNTIGAVCKKIATFLCLENPHLYTGHCLRRSSATQLVDGGGDITTLKRLGGWKSTTVAEGTIAHN